VSPSGATMAPSAFSTALGVTAFGTDGATDVNTTTLIGLDFPPRSGMYALRGQGCGIAVLSDADDWNYWTTQGEFGLEEGIYMILTGPAGDTIENAVAVKQQAGLDSYAAKLLFGDWLWWSDQVNGAIRLVSPQGFTAGRLANLSPEQSSLNKQLYSIIGSERSGTPGTNQNASYSSADLAVLLSAGIDVISSPQPGGNFWGVRGGHNSSSSVAVNGDNYTRLTNYIAATLAAGMGQYVGQVITSDLFRRIRATQLAFLQNMLGQGLLGTTDGSLPFSVVCDASNNPSSRTDLGYVQSDAQVQYQAINEKFIINMEGGQTVQVSRQTLPSGQVAT
jgi:Bacteriophage tail sheath protein